jgi:hypothetical protein
MQYTHHVVRLQTKIRERPHLHLPRGKGGDSVATHIHIYISVCNLQQNPPQSVSHDERSRLRCPCHPSDGLEEMLWPAPLQLSYPSCKSRISEYQPFFHGFIPPLVALKKSYYDKPPSAANYVGHITRFRRPHLLVEV